jgi:glucokinase
VELNARASLIIGVYVGGQTVAGALADLNGVILHRHTLPTLAGAAGVAQVIEVIRALVDQAQAMGVPVRGVGVGAPSVVHYPDGVVALAPSLGWRDLPLQHMLQEAIGLPVIVENEVNLIALGEAWRGAGQGIDALVCLSLGAGIGAGIVLNGRLYRGAHHAAGEVGYVIPGERFLGHVYDVYGCLEGLAGYEGIVQRARLRLATAANGERTSLLAGRTISVDDVLAAARAGDALACAVIDETVDYLTIALANLACVIDPQRVIVSGELAAHGDLFLEPIRRRLMGLLPVLPEVVLSELKLDAPILGAVITALRETSGAVEVLFSRA